MPVILDGAAPLLVLAAETAGADALAELEALSGAAPGADPGAGAGGGDPARADVGGCRGGCRRVAGFAVSRLKFINRLPIRRRRSPRCGRRCVAVPAPALRGCRDRAGQDRPAAAGLAGGAAAGRVGCRPSGWSRFRSPTSLGYADSEVAGLRQIVSADVPLTDAPDSRVVAFRSDGSAIEHLAIVIGRPETRDAPLVRIHSECFTGDLLGSMRCDCGEQLRGAIRRMAEDGAGVLLYLAQEGRGIGLVNKLRAYGLQDRGLDTMDANRVLGWGADERNFLIGATMLRLMGISAGAAADQQSGQGGCDDGLRHRGHRPGAASVRTERR